MTGGAVISVGGMKTHMLRNGAPRLTTVFQAWNVCKTDITTHAGTALEIQGSEIARADEVLRRL